MLGDCVGTRIRVQRKLLQYFCTHFLTIQNIEELSCILEEAMRPYLPVFYVLDNAGKHVLDGAANSIL